MLNPFFARQGPGGETRGDNIRVSKKALKLGEISLTRVNTIPPMNYGRPGDVVLIDNTDNPSSIPQSNLIPTGVGMWIKVPLTYSSAIYGNVVGGFPGGKSSAGNIIEINSIPVVLTSPHTAKQCVIDINAATISNLSALFLGEAVVLRESTGGPITVKNVSGNPAETLGLFSQPAINTFNPNGVWIPFVLGTSLAGSSSLAEYVLLTPDPSLSQARTLQANIGLKIIDHGPGNAIELQQDIIGTTPLAEPLSNLDQFLVHNISSGNIERASIEMIHDSVLSSIDPSQNRFGVFGGATTNNLANPIPNNSLVHRVYLTIDTPYPLGTTIEIGDADNSAKLMNSNSNTPSEINTYTTIPLISFPVTTQLIVTIGGSPAFGSCRVIVGFIKN